MHTHNRLNRRFGSQDMPQKLAVYGNASAEQVIETLVSGLANPHEPLYCADCLHACLSALTHPSLGLAHIPILRTDHHDVYNVCMTFLTVTRAAEELDRLEKSMSTCQCDRKNPCLRELHRIADRDFGNPPLGRFKAFVSGLMIILHNALQPALDAENIHKVWRNAEKATREGRLVPWPSKLQDLLPFGLDSILAYGAMVELCPVPTSLGLLGSIMDICREETIPPFLASPSLSGSVVSVVLVPIVRYHIHPGDPPAGLLTDVKRIALLCRVLSTYCDPNQLVQFSNQAEEQSHQGDALNTCSVLLEWLPPVYASIHPPNPQALEDYEYCDATFRSMGAFLHFYLSSPFDSDGSDDG